MTLSLAKMLFTCDFTVPSARKRAEPMASLLFPYSISFQHIDFSLLKKPN
jgi:hypothetical protein